MSIFIALLLPPFWFISLRLQRWRPAVAVGVEACELIGGQRQAHGSEKLLNLRDASGAGDRSRHGRLRREPRERNLCRGRRQFGRDRFDRLEYAKAVLVHVS